MRAVLTAVLAVVVAGCGGAASHSSTSSSTGSTTATAPVRPHHDHRVGPPPGTLPQTHQLPSSHTAAFRQEMRVLWRAVVSNSVQVGMPAFFPEQAYAQVKAIANPAADFQDRLVSEYRLDIGAAHALLGSGAGGARLVGVTIPASFAHWVDPNACYNRVGYWEVPNARLRYSEGGQLRSFGIASMISWRGVWYVVHLGAVNRPGAGGVVDDPAVGPGVSAASSTC